MLQARNNVRATSLRSDSRSGDRCRRAPRLIPACGSSSTPVASSNSTTTSTTSSRDRARTRSGRARHMCLRRPGPHGGARCLHGGEGAYPSPPAAWSAATYAANYEPLTAASGGGPFLPEPARDEVLRHCVRLGRPRLGGPAGGVRPLQQGSGLRRRSGHLRRGRRLITTGGPSRDHPGDVRCRGYGSPRSAVHDPCHATGPARPDPLRRAGPHSRCGHPGPIGRQPAELAFPPGRRARQEGRSGPALPARHGRALDDRLQGPARGGPCRPRGARVRADVQGAAIGPVAGRQLRDGAPVPLPVQPVRPHRAAPSTPPSGTPCSPPGPRASAAA